MTDIQAQAKLIEGIGIAVALVKIEALAQITDTKPYAHNVHLLTIAMAGSSVAFCDDGALVGTPQDAILVLWQYRELCSVGHYIMVTYEPENTDFQIAS